MRFQNGRFPSSRSSWGVSDQTRPRSWASVFVGAVVASEIAIVAPKQTVQAKIAVQKFWAMLLG
jgi:hypothetical protein